MAFNTRQQVLGILLLALTAASVCRAQKPASPFAPSATPAAAPAGAADPAEAPAAPPEAPVLPPKVVCTGNQMTIAANNSTLSSVLDEVHRCMGTKIDLPEGAGAKRMFDRIGPGPASEVLDEFLSATGYNYIIGSSPANQEKIESIMLLARVADAASTIAADTDGRTLTPNRRAFLQMRQAAVPHPMTDADTTAAEAAAQGSAPAPDPVPADSSTTPAAATPDAQPGQPATMPNTTPAQSDSTTPPPASVPATNPSTDHPTTTQDQITNMQQMFELRKKLNQQNQNQNQNPPQP